MCVVICVNDVSKNELSGLYSSLKWRKNRKEEKKHKRTKKCEGRMFFLVDFS